MYLLWCNLYFESEFIDGRGRFIEKDYLNTYEYRLFSHSPATSIDRNGWIVFKGYRLGKYK